MEVNTRKRFGQNSGGLLLLLLLYGVHSSCQDIQYSLNSQINAEDNEVQVAGSTSCGDASDISGSVGSCSSVTRRYVLYDINRGEGFNLKRDVFVRIAPIIKSLNKVDSQSQWILVLPPWGHLPHWSTSKYFTWSTFFDVSAIQKYIPVMEFEEYLDEYGLDNHLNAFYQLQHFPLNSPISKSWMENVKAGIECESPLSFQITPELTYYANFWNTALFAGNASCLGVKGESSNIVQFLLSSNPRSVMLNKAEVILWDHYGGRQWWLARISLKFSSKLIDKAEKWIRTHFSNFNLKDVTGSSYLSVHLRRGDFIRYRKNQPSLLDVARQIISFLSKLEISHVFIASDGTLNDINFLKDETKSLISSSDITFLRFDCLVENLTEGECAVIDQIIASWGKNFIGTADSTFTLRIFEEREILGFHPDYNYYTLCADSLECAKSTRWPIQTY